MSNIHTRVREDRFHENRREAQHIVTTKYGYTKVFQSIPEKEVCLECKKDVTSSGVRLFGVLYHEKCFNKVANAGR